MHAVVRTYTGVGAKELFDILEKSKAEVEKTLSGVRGFVSYTLARTNDGGGFFGDRLQGQSRRRRVCSGSPGLDHQECFERKGRSTDGDGRQRYHPRDITELLQRCA